MALSIRRNVFYCPIQFLTQSERKDWAIGRLPWIHSTS